MVNLKEFRKANGLSQIELAKLLNVGQGFISQMEKGTRPIPADILSTLINNDKGWDTSMLIEKERSVQISNFSHSNVVGHGQININSSQSIDDQEQEENMVPVIPTNLYKETDVNIVDYINDEDNDIQLSPAVQQFPKTDLYYTVQTMAMYPHLHQGDIVALKTVKRWTPIVNGELYAIDTIDLGILVRFAYDRGDKIELRSSEDEKRFESFTIEKNDIYNIFRVVGLIRTNI